MREHQPDQQRLLLAGRGLRRGRALGAVKRDEIGQMRADQRAPGRRVAAAIVAQRRAVAILGGERGMFAAEALDFALERDFGPGERRSVVARRCDRGPQPRDAFDPRRGDRDAEFGGLALDRIQPGALPGPFFEQPVAASQGALELIDPRAMLRIDREHEPIEETPPLVRRAGEQPVHRRRQPDEAQMFGESARGGDRRAVDSVEPFGGAILDRRLQSDAELMTRAVLLDLDRDGEPAAPADTRAFAQIGAPEPAAGRKQRQSFQQICLAGAVLAVKRDQRTVDLDVEGRIGAEVPQHQPPNQRAAARNGGNGRVGHARRMCHVRGASERAGARLVVAGRFRRMLAQIQRGEATRWAAQMF